MLCESCGFAAAIETVPDRRHRVPSTFRLCRDCAAEARGVLMPPRTENHDARLAMLRALAAHPGPMTREMLLVAIAAEEDEKRLLHGVISGLIRATYVTAAGANLFLTPKGRKQVEPTEGAPEAPPVKPAEAREPGPLWTQAETAALSDLRAAVARVGIQGRNPWVACDLLIAAREAIEVGEGRQANAEEVVSARHLARVDEVIRALRSIEAALPGDQAGLSAAAIADRAVSALRTIHDLRRIKRLYNDDREAKERAEAERDKAVADLDTLNAETLEMHEKLEDGHRAEKAAHAVTREDLAKAIAAEKIAASCAAALRAENDSLTGQLMDALPAPDTDGHYWTEQGGRHVLSILRPVEVATVTLYDNAVGWQLVDENVGTAGHVKQSTIAAIDLAKRLAELAAGVRS